MKGDKGSVLENEVAVCLLKHVLARIDYLAEPCALHYLRTKEKHEVDFAITRDNVIENMIEVKSSNGSVSKGLDYFHKKYKIPAIQIVKDLKRERTEDGIEIIDLHQYLKSLYL